MTRFKSPNYTQTPNDLFEMMPEMGEAELRVTLAIIRLTLGYHRERVRISLSKLRKLTGMSVQGVINGTEAAEKRETITKVNDGGVNIWEINIEEPVNEVDTPLHEVESPLHEVEMSSPLSREPSIKENINKPVKQKDLVDGVLELGQNSKDHWPGREKMPEPMRDLMDVFVECTGIKPTRGQINDWFATASDWLEIGAQKADIRAAFEKSQPNIDQKRTGFTVGRPGSLTTTIQAVVGERRKTKTGGTLMEYMDRLMAEQGGQNG